MIIPRAFEVKAKIDENQDIFTLGLSPLNGNYEAAPGQFNMLQAFGIGESAISISRQNHGLLYHTIRAVGQVTHALHGLKKGDQLLLRGPFGQGWPLQQLSNYEVLIIAGGIGLVPLRPVLDHLTETKLKATLLYGTRAQEDVIFHQDLELWAKTMNIMITVDKPTQNWPHFVGVVPHLIPKGIQDPLKTLVLMCGPEVMMRFSLHALLERGVPQSQIFISMERNMQCGYGQCGHCQWGPYFICKDGPVMNYADIAPFFNKRDL